MLTDVTRGSVGAAMYPAVVDDAAADTRADSDEPQLFGGRAAGFVLAECHQVHVVVHQHRSGEDVGEECGYPYAVPAPA